MIVAALLSSGLAASPVFGQASIRLSAESPSSSQADLVAGELLTAITQGASSEQTDRLLDRAARVDQALARQLNDLQEPADSKQRDTRFRARSLLWLKRIEISSLSSELFAEGSADGLATANRAIQLARETLAVLPASSAVRDEVLRLLAEAYLKTGDVANAQKSLLAIVSPKAQEDSPRESTIDRLSLIAFAIRIALLKDDLPTAKRRLDSYFGRDPMKAAKSIEMDLVRLRYLLAVNDSDPSKSVVGEWIDAIEQRHGPSVRRTAETSMIRARDEPSGSIRTPGLDPRIRRADAAYRLRTGQELLAAATFARAAIDDDNADRAIQSAIASTAILAKNNKASAAVELLLQVASKHAEHPQSDALQLQAAVIAQESDPDQVIGILQRLLASNSATESSSTARRWLVQLHQSNGDWQDAAIVVSQTPQQQWTDATALDAMLMWERAIGQADCQWFDTACLSQYELHRRAIIATMSEVIDGIAETSPGDANKNAQLTGIARSLFGQADELVPQRITPTWFEEFADFRRGKRDTLTTPPQPWANLVASTLHRDADMQPARRRLISSVLLGLAIEGRETEKMQWSLWNRKINDGLERLKNLRSIQKDESEVLAIAARSLQQAGGTQALSQATRLWNEIAGGLSTSSPAWAEAKVSAIECQALMGQQTEAAAAAKWMSLVHPPYDELLADRLQTLVEVGR